MLLSEQILELKVAKRTGGFDGNPSIDALLVEDVHAGKAPAFLAHRDVIAAHHARLLALLLGIEDGNLRQEARRGSNHRGRGLGTRRKCGG